MKHSNYARVFHKNLITTVCVNFKVFLWMLRTCPYKEKDLIYHYRKLVLYMHYLIIYYMRSKNIPSMVE
jgi:hypothetical protein